MVTEDGCNFAKPMLNAGLKEGLKRFEDENTSVDPVYNWTKCFGILDSCRPMVPTK
jgi:hypothetical protein